MSSGATTGRRLSGPGLPFNAAGQGDGQSPVRNRVLGPATAESPGSPPVSPALIVLRPGRRRAALWRGTGRHRTDGRGGCFPRPSRGATRGDRGTGGGAHAAWACRRLPSVVPPGRRFPSHHLPHERLVARRIEFYNTEGSAGCHSLGCPVHAAQSSRRDDGRQPTRTGFRVAPRGPAWQTFGVGSTHNSVSPVTHMLAGWLLAGPAAKSTRERLAITVAGVLPDLDGAGLLVDAFNRVCRGVVTDWFGAYHHLLLHGFFGAVGAVTAAYLVGCRRPFALLLVAASFHLHLVLDVMGSRGPSAEDLWSIFYFAPMSTAFPVTWAAQWPLNAWQNLFFTAALLGGTVWVAIRRGISPVSLLSDRVDALVVSALRRRWVWIAGS